MIFNSNIKRLFFLVSFFELLLNLFLILFWLYALQFEFFYRNNPIYVSQSLDILIAFVVLSYFTLVYSIFSLLIWVSIKKHYSINLQNKTSSVLLLYIPYLILYIANLIIKSTNPIPFYFVFLIFSTYKVYNIAYLHLKNWNKIFPENKYKL